MKRQKDGRHGHIGLRWLAGGSAALIVCGMQAPYFVSYASVTTEIQAFRNNVIQLSGIMDTKGELSQTVTRGEFAKALVLASSYKDSAAASSIAAANDVPATSEYAPYIRIALRQGWMRTYLGGQFKPDEPVKMQDATKAILTLLGYTDDDFSGDIAASRLASFNSLELNEEVGQKSLTDTLSVQECINLFYNLLKASPKTGSGIYGSLFDLSLASDGEIDPNDLMESSMTGPLLVRTIDELKKAIPFDVESANLYFNGYSSRYMSYDSAIRQNGWLVVYYNEGNNTVWAYGEDFGDSQYHVVKGEITKIYYEANNIVSPTSVVLDDNATYLLGSSEVKFMLGINGDIKLGDDVVLICQTNTGTDSDGDDLDTYTVVGVIKYQRNTDGSTTGTSNVIYAGSSGPGSGTTVSGASGNSGSGSDTDGSTGGTDSGSTGEN
ncbi:MAG: S-layer homology domain-containing protein [Eubacteriales bacterium]|nr:S-layer homology domain-containing protein [Eubacteriales bacterium]